MKQQWRAKMASNRFNTSGNNPNFDLDQYIVEKSNEEYEREFQEPSHDYPQPTTRRNMVVIIAFFVVTGIWAISGAPLSIFNFEDGNEGIDGVIGNPIETIFEAPTAPLPPQLG